ncbi:HNH endonuclease [Corynebacterium phoceense]|uniref:HNH endonuclease n=1 Tax=Corynebacterium phoceense TaxID=1686286 RepID=UPI00211BD03D|nr:HNH endonuclease signature motif containing protein [Corynebacterium phoceense]MCQ9345872.1 HNH endonuclease [Corynebacterium phoceense]
MSGFTSNRRTRARGLPAPLRAKVMYRADGLCEKRGPNCTTVATEVDHIVPEFEGGTDDLDNLEATCAACHKPKTQREAQRARARFSRRRPPPPRPGMLPGSSTDRRQGPLGIPSPPDRAARTA